ncbi:transcription factor Adf-1 [Drosophila grimshawi]|uniref:GH16194 n=1 Tax=Drosophila grimshawi TaxID=7222 RepID=B4IX27_DROGR|nr:transcription factor Adf-1 [Drosophila grimshawi]EDV96333.1 GH16194 [Drosophila grimshawi]
MSTSPEFDIRLIEMVRANPGLYEEDLRQAPYYTRRKRKTELWCSIATSLKTDVSACITRWNYIREKMRKEQLKPNSDWSLLPKLRFIRQHKHGSSSTNHHKEHQQQTQAVNPVDWCALSPGQLIEHNVEDDILQEAMDEQHVTATIVIPPTTTTTTTASSTGDDPMKRIEALLQGLGVNRSKAEKKILAYLCKCNLRALNEEQIDDIFI